MIRYLFGKFFKLFIVPTILKDVKKAKTAKICSGTEMRSVKIKDYSYIGHNCKISYATIGKYTSIAGNCFIGGGSHPIQWVSTSPKFHAKKSVLGSGFEGIHAFQQFSQTTIGNDVWIGSNVLIKSGVTIGDGSIVGMGSVVTHDIPPYEIWAGNPARLIKKRFDEEICSFLLNVRWWDNDDNTIKKLAPYFDEPILFRKKYYELLDK